jgi:Carbohydrate-selective porin, OprB family/S-layer homology domain
LFYKEWCVGEVMKKAFRNLSIVCSVLVLPLLSATSAFADIKEEKQEETEALTSLDEDSVLDFNKIESGTAVVPIEETAQNPSDTSTIDETPVTSVSQFSDVAPTDWAFQALQSLVERYGCIAGYPNRTYRGNRALTRYEFAAGLNSCLEQATKLIASSTSDLVTKQDLDTVQRLNQEFQPELAQLRGRIDNLEQRVAEVKASQFSATTKLTGEFQFVVGGVLAGNNVITKQPAPRTITLSDRVRLILSSSFSGKDQLRISLFAGNITSLGGVPNPRGNFSNPLSTQNPTGGIFGTFDGRTADNASPAFGANQFYLGGIRYRFPLTENTQFNVFAQSDGALEIGLSGPTNPYFEGSAANGISRFSRRNMVYNYGDTGPGIAILHKFSKQFELGVSYSAPNGDNPTPNNGLFTGRYVAFGQLTYFSPSRDFRFALSYANTYSPPGTLGQGGTNFGPAAGSNLANSTISTNLQNAANGIVDKGTVGNLYGVGAFYKLSPKFAVNGFVGYSSHRFLEYGDADVWNWGVGLSFPDLGKEGSLGGLFVGMAPKLTSLSRNVDLGAGRGQADKDTSLHVEGWYQYQLTDNIAITPGIIWVTTPNSDASNPGAVITWLRTTFRF